jgi:hypothetical protein
MLAFTLGQVVTNRELIKEALNADQLLMNAVEVAARETLENQPAISNLPPLIRDSGPLQAALDNFLPPGWASEQSDQVVDAVFDYLETGDESALVLTVELAPLLQSLRGDPGREVVLAVLQGLPPCTTRPFHSVPIFASSASNTATMSKPCRRKSWYAISAAPILPAPISATRHRRSRPRMLRSAPVSSGTEYPAVCRPSSRSIY